MKEIDDIKEELEKKRMLVQKTLNDCHNSSKTSWKYFHSSIVFSLSTAVIFTGLRDVLDTSSLVLVCAPLATCAVAVGTLGAINSRKTNNLYKKLHELDVDVFDLNLEIFRFNQEMEDLDLDEDEQDNDNIDGKTLKKDFI